MEQIGSTFFLLISELVALDQCLYGIVAALVEGDRAAVVVVASLHRDLLTGLCDVEVRLAVPVERRGRIRGIVVNVGRREVDDCALRKVRLIAAVLQTVCLRIQLQIHLADRYGIQPDLHTVRTFGRDAPRALLRGQKLGSNVFLIFSVIIGDDPVVIYRALLIGVFFAIRIADRDLIDLVDISGQCDIGLRNHLFDVKIQ